MYRVALLAVSILACTTAVEAQQPSMRLEPSRHQSSPKGYPDSVANPLSQVAKSPLLFYVARAEHDACGIGCNEWIAAEGHFDFGAPARFKSFLSRLGRRNPPIFFHSAGGIQQAAENIGRQMRERGMTAGVARTLPDACVGSGSRTCESAKKSGRELGAEWSSIGAVCASACVYALIGARARWVPPGSRLAVHASRYLCVLSNGTILDSKDARCPKNSASAGLLRYVKQMGVGPALVEAAQGVPHESFRFLSRSEIARFGIAHDQFEETPWIVARGASPRLVQLTTHATDLSGEMAWSGAVALECYTRGNLRLIYFRPAVDKTMHGTATVSALLDDREYRLITVGSALEEWIEPDTRFDQYAVPLPLGLVDRGKFRLKVETSDSNLPDDARTIVVHPSVTGFHHAWKAISFWCAN